METRPRPLVLLQQSGVRLRQVHTALFVGVDAGLVLLPQLERSQAGRLHLALGGQRLHSPDVDRAPDTPSPAWREPDRKDLIVYSAANAIDPAVTQRLIHRLGPVDTRFACVLLEVTKVQFRGSRMIFLEPGPERGRCRKERQLSCHAVGAG